MNTQGPSPRQLRRALRKWCRSHDGKAWRCLLSSLALWLASMIALPLVGWLAVPVLVGAFLRLFSIFHDAGHGAFFCSKRANDFLGYGLGMLVLTPFRHWKNSHNQHHRAHGNLDRHDPGETLLWTQKEYEDLSPHKRLFWRIVRAPVVFFFLLPALRWALGYPLQSKSLPLLFAWLLVGLYCVFFTPLLLASIYLSTVAGFVLFHLHHSVPQSYRKRQADWDPTVAALEGSTHIQLPRWMAWCTLGLELHHLHHLLPQIPCYHLQRAHDSAPPGAWDKVPTVQLRRCLPVLRYALWEEHLETPVPFGHPPTSKRRTKTPISRRCGPT